MTNTNPTKEQILELARSNPIIFHFYKAYSDGQMTWEEALGCMVLGLAQQSKDAQMRMTKLIEHHPLGLWLNPSDYCVIIRKDELDKALDNEQKDQTQMDLPSDNS